jgi:hypothetical protein
MSTKKTATFPEFAADATNQALAAWKEAQELSLRTAESTVGLLASGAVGLPSVTQAFEAGFDVAARVLEQQRSYAVRLAEIWTQSPRSNA